MTEHDTSSAVDSEPSGETPGQRQARLRRERREAKIKADGTSRLDRITKASGRQGEVPDSQPPSSPPVSSVPSSDSSSTFFQPHEQAQMEAEMRSLLRAGAPQPGLDITNDRLRQAQSGPGWPPRQGDGSQPEDPMVQMLSQLLGAGNNGAGLPGMPPGQAGGGELPPGLASMLGLGQAGAQAAPGINDQGVNSAETRISDYTWKIIHALVALALGIHVTVVSKGLSRHTASLGQGTRRYRTTSHDEFDGPGFEEAGRFNVFWAFATVQLILQSTRYYLERGKLTSRVGGMIGMVSAVIPRPWSTYLQLAARYSGIWSTIVEDALVLVFVVGVVSWWNGNVR